MTIIYSKGMKPMSEDDNTISILAEINYITVGLCIISIRPISPNTALVPRKVAYMENLC